MRDGFVLRRQTRTGGRIYSHSDGRMTVVHYHRGSDTFTRKTLASILDAVGWTEDDAPGPDLVLDEVGRDGAKDVSHGNDPVDSGVFEEGDVAELPD